MNEGSMSKRGSTGSTAGSDNGPSPSKRTVLSPPEDQDPTGKLPVGDGATSSPAERVLRRIASRLPLERFGGRVPAVVMQHMVYSGLPDRTAADRDVDRLRQRGVLRIFKLGGDQESHAVLFADSYVQLIRTRCSDSRPVRRFVSDLLPAVAEVAVDKPTLARLAFTETDVKDLVQNSLLSIKSATCYWFTFPGAGEFMKNYLKGRNALLTTIKKAKYQQILRNELESRPMKKTAPLGLTYHIDDIVGADLVTCVDTSSGPLLKFVQSK